jgi:hypothetical protein
MNLLSHKTPQLWLPKLAFALILTLANLAADDHLTPNPSVFETYQLKYGITIKLPRHWKTFNKGLMDAMAADTELKTGIQQGNNDTIIAANFYDDDSGDPAAAARVSVRTKKTYTQTDVREWTQAELDAQADAGYQMALSALQNSGNKRMRMTPYRASKDQLGGCLAIRTDYQATSEIRTHNVSIYVIFLGDRVVNVTLSCDPNMASLLTPTMEELKKSIIIGDS